MLPIHRTNTWLPDVFNDLFFNDFTPRVSNTSPAINVIESEKEYKVELAAPGMKKEDFDGKSMKMVTSKSSWRTSRKRKRRTRTLTTSVVNSHTRSLSRL